jgi:hypothetical protein
VKPAVHNRVCALVGPDGDPARQAVASGSGRPGTIVDDTRLRPGVERALAAGADWIWVLDGSAVPRPDALAALLAALERSQGLPEPSLLTGVVVDSGGRVAADRSPWYRRYTMDVTLSSVERGLLPVRASIGPALVRSDAAAATPPPDGARVALDDVLGWTAALLRDRTGYLVPESESESVAEAADPLGRLTTAARLMLSDAMGRWDRTGVALELAERAGRRPSVGRGA